MRILLAILVIFSLSFEPAIAHPKGGKGEGGKGSTQDDTQESTEDNPPTNQYASGGDKHEAVVSVISNIIASETGFPSKNYKGYATDLANTLGHFDSATLARIFGDKAGKLP